MGGHPDGRGRAYDTSVVTPDEVTPTRGTFTQTLVLGRNLRWDSNHDSDGPFERRRLCADSDPTSNLDAGTYSYDATYNGDDGINHPSSGLCAAFH